MDEVSEKGRLGFLKNVVENLDHQGETRISCSIWSFQIQAFIAVIELPNGQVRKLVVVVASQAMVWFGSNKCVCNLCRSPVIARRAVAQDSALAWLHRMVQVATSPCFWLCTFFSQLISQPGWELWFQTHQRSKTWLLEYYFVGHWRDAGEMDLRCAGLHWGNSNDSKGKLWGP